MSTKPKRASTATPQPQSQPGGVSTPVPGASNRSGSPLSPTLNSRLIEKAELQHLNDRLACYIDRMRNLETENSRLTLIVQDSRENIVRETTNIKAMYDTELNDARRLLDETSREKAKLEIDTKRLWEQTEDLRSKLDKKVKECTIAEGNARMFEGRVNDLNGKYSVANSERKKAHDDLNDAKNEIDRLRKQLDESRKLLEDETLARVDLENNMQSLKEELVFKDNIHTQEINETRSRRQTDITEIDGRLCEQYETKLQQSLQELRDQYESQMRANRDDIEMLYETKINNLQNAANRNNSLSTNTIEELRSSRTRIEGLNGRINELETSNTALNARIRELEQMLDSERTRFNRDLSDMDFELQRLREEMTKQLKEYQDLMDIKVSLDLEIAAYDKLLCGEESRLNLTPSSNVTATVSSLSQSFKAGRTTPHRRAASRGPSVAVPMKRRRFIDETEDISQFEFFSTNSAKGDIQILEADPEGKFVKLHNKGSKEIQIGSWQLLRKAGVNETTFKFHHTCKIDGGASITVWSIGTGVAHEPPTTIVMKKLKWATGDNMKTSLVNQDGEELAVTERVKRATTTHRSRHIGPTRAGASVLDGRNGEEYHDGNSDGNKEKCSIM